MQVTRWRRYGKDRLYVRDDQGADVGWWDLATDEGHPAAPDLEVALGAAVTAWRADADAPAAVDEDGATAHPDDPAPPMPPSAPDPAEAPASEPPTSPTSPDLPSEPAGELPALAWVDGVAGGSAAHEFQRRHDARRERVQTAHPKIGKLLLAVFDDPQSTRAWSVGADGENVLGETLEPLAGPTLRVLHDRRIPRTTANIDHLVVCSSGVFVIDAKRYLNRRPELRVEGGLFRPRTELLYVGGSERTKLVDGLHKQLDLVRSALADQPDVPVRGVLCFVQADWPLIGGDFMVRDVAVVWPKRRANCSCNPVRWTPTGSPPFSGSCTRRSRARKGNHPALSADRLGSSEFGVRERPRESLLEGERSHHIRSEPMPDTKTSAQSIRRAARQAAVAAQAKRRAQAAERDKRLDAAALTLIVALRERDALERQAGAAIKAMLTDGLTLADVVTWTDGETTLKEATRLADLATEAARS